MSRTLQRTLLIMFLLVLMGAGAVSLVRQARAQDGGETTLQFNSPTIVTLNAGQSVTRTFQVQTGGSFELRLSRLAEYTYTAVLIGPDQAAAPLTPGADGNTTFTPTPPVMPGTYSLVLQAASGSGDMLIQLLDNSTPAVALQLGDTPADLQAQVLRFTLVPPPNTADTLLTISLVLPEGAAPANLPALKLLDAATGQEALSLGAGFLPEISAFLPAQASFNLEIEPGTTPQQLSISWLELQAPVAPVTGACQVSFSGPVNVRSGPSTFYPIIGSAGVGLTLPVIGRNADATWWQVTQANGQVGWVSNQIASTVTGGDCSGIGLVNVPPPPPTFTPSATVAVSPSATGATATPSLTPTATNTSTGSETPTLTATWTWTPTDTPTVTETWTATWTPTP